MSEARPSIWSFAQALRTYWLAAMSGSFSVPFTAAAVYLDNKYAQGIFALLAFCALWFAAYRVWLVERQTNYDLRGLLRGLFDTEKAIERLVELHAEGKRLYNDTDCAPDVYNRVLEEWESRVADFILQHYSASELHAFRSYTFYNGGEYMLPEGVPQEWRKSTEKQRIMCTARIVALDRTIQHGSNEFLGPRLKAAEWLEKHQ